MCMTKAITSMEMGDNYMVERTTQASGLFSKFFTY